METTYTAEQITEMWDTWVNFNGFTGETCGHCKKQPMCLLLAPVGSVIVENTIFNRLTILTSVTNFQIWERRKM